MSSEKENSIFKEALDWEASRIHQIERSERRAWKVSLGAMTLAALSCTGIFLLIPLKESVPYLIRVNQETGAHEVLTSLNTQNVTYEDVLDKYWLSIYIRSRESYDWHMLQKDYDTVGLLSSSKVGKEYAALFKGEEALDKKQGNRVRTRIDILSIVPDGKGRATVRFTKKNQQTADGLLNTSHWVATIAYQYKNPSKMKESHRLINPFGFQVYSYRVDPELISRGK